jgi:hypothetical protein
MMIETIGVKCKCGREVSENSILGYCEKCDNKFIGDLDLFRYSETENNCENCNALYATENVAYCRLHNKQVNFRYTCNYYTKRGIEYDYNK